MKRTRYIVIALLIAAAGGLAVWALRPASGKSTALSPTPSPAPTASAVGPLAIAKIRSHPVKPSPITIESELPARGGCRVQDVSFTSEGLKEYALVTQPGTTPPPGGFPVIVLAHGYIQPDQYSTTGNDYGGWTGIYCNAGYMVVKLDFRGHGRSEGTATGGHFSSEYTYDLLNLTASLPNLASANADRVAWAGHSMGAHVVLRGLVADHGLPVKSALLISGVVGSLEDIAFNWPRPQIPAGLSARRARILEQLGTREANPAAWHDGSAINYVSDIKVPVQIHHGDADTVVPLAFSQSLDRALTAAAKPHELIVYPGGDHQFGHAPSAALFIQKSQDFLKANL